MPVRDEEVRGQLTRSRWLGGGVSRKLLSASGLLLLGAALASGYAWEHLSPDPVERELLQAGFATGTLASSVAVVDPAGELHVASFRRDPNLRVPVGSARKWLTAALVLSLVDDRLLSLDDPVARYIPMWHGPTRRQITVRMLLSHTAGIAPRPPTGLCSGSATLQTCVDQLGTLQLLNRPGAAFRYSSAGFNVAARVVEVAAGESYRDLLWKRLLSPLDMEDTELRRAGPGLEEMVGEIWTTPADFTRFLEMVLHRGVRGGTRVLSEAAIAEMERGQTGGVPKVGMIPYEVWWDEGDDYYGLGMWRNIVDADGNCLVGSAEGKDGFIAWYDRRRGVVGVASMRQHRLMDHPRWRPDYVGLIDRFGSVVESPDREVAGRPTGM